MVLNQRIPNTTLESTISTGKTRTALYQQDSNFLLWTSSAVDDSGIIEARQWFVTRVRHYQPLFFRFLR